MPREGGARTLQRTVDRHHRRVEELGHLVGLPLQHFAQDQYRALTGREVLQRVTTRGNPEPVDDAQRELLARYVDAFERFDVESLVKLLHDDATMSMPPYPMWLQGADELGTWLNGPGSACRGSRLAPISANGAPAFAQWRVNPAGGYHAWSIHVLRVSWGRIAGIDFFVDPDLFPLFDQPVDLEA